MLFQQATKSFIINYGNNSDTFLDMSVQYKTLPCLQLKCIPRKERSKEDAHGNLFLFSVLCSNKQFFKIACSQMWGGRRRLTKVLGVGVQKTCFSSGSSILVKIPQWKKKKTTFNILKPKSFDLIPDIQTKSCYVMETVFQPTHSLIFFYGLSSQQL